MQLPTSTRLGPYEVLAPLGAGGMGEVYRARDSRLGRDVAIKVLPSELASDVGRLKRFEKEARSASSLNHPNIVTIYEIGSAGSVSYIAMELVEGKTLREHLFAGALPVKRVLQIAAQVADGLARAHEAGIVHRDLKPENVMVTKDGRVKILDFGLAKLTYSGTGSDEGTNLPTETGTGAGVVLGTVGYMSPEQASGQPVDFRSDQFSFGSILYEMATGKRAFHKKTGVDTLSAILNEDPTPVDSLNPQVPTSLRWIVERCLAKDQEGRYASTKDLARDLAELGGHLSEAAAAGESMPLATRKNRLWIVATLVAALAGGILVGKSVWPTPTVSTPRFQQLTFRRGELKSARFAPDGYTIIYAAKWDGNPLELFSTRPESIESRSLGLPSADILSISTSGEMAIQLQPGRFGTLAQVALSGGAPREILERVQAADWSPTGKELAVVRAVGYKSRLEFPMGKPLFETNGWMVFRPRVSPKGDRVALIESGSLVVFDLAGHKKTLLEEGGFYFDWSPVRDELWFTRRGVRGVTELKAVTLTGQQRLIAQIPGEFGLLDISHDGRLLMERVHSRNSIRGVAPGDTRERDLSWHDASVPAALSRDGKLLLFTEQGAGAETEGTVYVRGTNASPAIPLGKGVAEALSPDGKWVLAKLAAAPSRLPTLVLIPTGAGQLKPITLRNVHFRGCASFTPDGKQVLFLADEPKRAVRSWALNIETGQLRPVTPENVQDCLLSPDGKLLAARGPQGFSLYPVEGGAPRDIPGIGRSEFPISWSTDGRSFFVLEAVTPPWKVYRFEIETGRRVFWREFTPPDPATDELDWVLVAADGKSWVYSYHRYLSDLYLVEGVK